MNKIYVSRRYLLENEKSSEDLGKLFYQNNEVFILSEHIRGVDCYFIIDYKKNLQCYFGKSELYPDLNNLKELAPEVLKNNETFYNALNYLVEYCKKKKRNITIAGVLYGHKVISDSYKEPLDFLWYGISIDNIPLNIDEEIDFFKKLPILQDFYSKQVPLFGFRHYRKYKNLNEMLCSIDSNFYTLTNDFLEDEDSEKQESSYYNELDKAHGVIIRPGKSYFFDNSLIYLKIDNENKFISKDVFEKADEIFDRYFTEPVLLDYYKQLSINPKFKEPMQIKAISFLVWCIKDINKYNANNYFELEEPLFKRYEKRIKKLIAEVL